MVAVLLLAAILLGVAVCIQRSVLTFLRHSSNSWHKVCHR